MTRNIKVQTPGQPLQSAAPAKQEDMATVNIAGREMPLKEIVQAAFETSGLSVDEWESLPANERDERVGLKTRELAEQLRAAGNSLSQYEVQKRAQAAVDARRNGRKAGGANAKHDPLADLPHSSDIDPKTLAAPMQCRDGIVVPDRQEPLPKNFR